MGDLGQHEQAIAESERAREIDPLSPNKNVNVGLILYFARKYDQAIHILSQTIQLNPNYALAHTTLGYAYVGKGRYTEAIAAYKESIRLTGDNTSDRCYLGYAYAMSGQQSEAETILKQLQTTREYVSPAELSVLYAGLGEKEQALDALEKAYIERDLQLQFLGSESHYDSLRSEPRFADLMQRVGLQQ